MYTRVIKLTALLFLPAATAMALEEPDYDVLLSTKHYEIRRYAPYIIAEVDVEGDHRSSGNKAFRILAGYIFGNNAPGEKMSMTAPVESQPDGARMNMTAPVLSDAPENGQSEYTYAFVMERQYNLQTLPAPLDPRIRIREKPARIVAARRYSGGWSESNYSENETALLEALRTDRVQITGSPLLARYNGPFTPWFLRRNEVLVEIDWQKAASP